MTFTVIVKFLLASLKVPVMKILPESLYIGPKATILILKTFTKWPSTGKSFEFFPYLTAHRKHMRQSTNDREGRRELNSP